MVKKLGVGCAIVLAAFVVLAILASQSGPTTVAPGGGTTTGTPGPTPVAPAATPAATATPPPSPVVLRGTGQTATELVTLPAAMSMGTFTHQGRSNFVVYAFRGERRDLLINVIGNYAGIRPLFYSEPVRFQVEADGPWTATIAAVEGGGTVTANARGDWVGKFFTPPGTGAYRFTHDGQSNFAVYLHCSGQRQLIQNEIGAFNGSKIIQFGRAPCVWEVIADGTWVISGA